MDIKVTEANKVYVRIQCDFGIAKELSEYFTFRVPNFQFHPLFRKKNKAGKPVWDGKKRLFSLKDHTLYYGLLNKLDKFAKDRDYKIEYELPIDAFNIPPVQEFFDTLGIPKHFVLRDYQLKSIFDCVMNKRALLLSPTSSGKSLINYVITRYLLDFNLKKILIIVPRIQLVHQLFYDFDDYGWETKKYAHPIYAGQDKIKDVPVYVSTWQSLQEMPDEYFHQFDAVIVDEAHEAKAKEVTRILENCVNANYRIGMTGTLDGTETHKIVLEGLFGPVVKYISTKELIDQGHAAPLDIRCIVLKYPDLECNEIRHSMIKKPKKKDGEETTDTSQHIAMKNFTTELEFILNHRKRNLFITSLALQQEKNTLVTFQYVEGEKKPHGKTLYEMIKKNTNRPVFFVHGSVDVEVREEIRKIVEKENNCIIVASTGVFSMGINMKNLHCIILTSPSKGRIKLLQTIGRGLRLHESKEKVVLYDIADDLRVAKYKNYTLTHFEKRIDIYNSEKFDYKIYPVKLGDS